MFMILALAFASATPDTNPPAAATPAPATEPAKKEKKICRMDPATSGSRMPRRVCLTQSEWDNHAQGMSNSAHSGYSGSTDDH